MNDTDIIHSVSNVNCDTVSLCDDAKCKYVCNVYMNIYMQEGHNKSTGDRRDG